MLTDLSVTAAEERTPKSKSDLQAAREAFTYAWRPAGSMSLAERWLKAGEGEAEGSPRAAPPRPPAPPRALKLKPRKLLKR